jgi:hypothetical protein
VPGKPEKPLLCPDGDREKLGVPACQAHVVPTKAGLDGKSPFRTIMKHLNG